MPESFDAANVVTESVFKMVELRHKHLVGADYEPMDQYRDSYNEALSVWGVLKNQTQGLWIKSAVFDESEVFALSRVQSSIIKLWMLIAMPALNVRTMDTTSILSPDDIRIIQFRLTDLISESFRIVEDYDVDRLIAESGVDRDAIFNTFLNSLGAHIVKFANMEATAQELMGLIADLTVISKFFGITSLDELKASVLNHLLEHVDTMIDSPDSSHALLTAARAFSASLQAELDGTPVLDRIDQHDKLFSEPTVTDASHSPVGSYSAFNFKGAMQS